MSDRVKGFVVALDQDYYEDDAECIRQAILMTKGVLNVEASMADHNDWINRQKANHDLTMRVLNALKDD
jgi:hypothetical protein